MNFSDFSIELGGKTGEEVQTTCPQCSNKRKNAKARCLSVNTVKGVWLCHHCDWRGSLKSGEDRPGKRLYARPIWSALAPGEAIYRWFDQRGISKEIVDSEGITEVSAYLPQCEDTVPCLAFPYRKGGEVVNVKYRALKDKAFRQVSGAEKVLYRQDCIQTDSVVIVEGEIDALSVVQAGFQSVVSVPDGAPAPTTKNYASKFTYLDQDPDPFELVQSIVLAVDADEPGQVLQRELARRLGSDRCSFVTWPSGCKDANDALRQGGKDLLQHCLKQAKPFPVQDVVEVESISEQVCRNYYAAPTRGLSTGWETVDQHYTIEAGQLTVVTGIPSSGKSEWLDALALNLATLHGWRFAVCSPENAPVETHCAKLVEKQVGKPFWVGITARMSPAELAEGLGWLHEHVTFIMPEETLTVQGVLDRAAILVRRKGIKGLIIDPFNEFDHTRDRGQTETEYIGQVLGAMKRWARKFGVHVWLVAHPQKLYRRDDGSYPVPTPYDINGSANFRNKADNCITVWRNMEEPESPIQIHVQKVRFKHIGSVGMAELLWEKKNGRYRTPLDETIIDVREW
jgi:twinkle protein